MSGPFERQGIYIPKPERPAIVMAAVARTHSSPSRPAAASFTLQDKMTDFPDKLTSERGCVLDMDKGKDWEVYLDQTGFSYHQIRLLHSSNLRFSPTDFYFHHLAT